MGDVRRTTHARLCLTGLIAPLGLVLLLTLGAAERACAQRAVASAAEARSAFEEQLRAGVQSLESDEPARAATLLEEVFGAEAGYASAEHGAAAYWLGKAYERQGEDEEAHRVWIEGQRALSDAGVFDVRLADAYLRALFAADFRKERLEAAEVYLRLLSHADSALTEPEAAIVRRHAAQSALLLEEEKRAQLSGASVHDTAWTLKDGAGERLVAWWQRQDRAPATPENERLEEHLHRLAEARAQYAHDERATGLDDRGETYVRYGPPYQQRSISYNDAGFHRDVFRFGVNVSSFDFPENELWTYPHIHHAAYFVFVEEEEGLFRIGRSEDLMPSRLSNVFSNSERHLNRAVSALAAMRYIFRDLALYHPDFGSLYNDIDNYANWQEMNAKEYQLTGQAPSGTVMRRVGAGIGQERLVFAAPSFGIDLPSQFVQRKAQEQKTVDYHAERARKQVMPPQYSQLLDSVDSLNLAVRTARFLEADGTTRTEVYWGTLAEHLRMRDADEDEESVVKLTAVHYDRDYDRRGTVDKWYETASVAREQGLVIPTVLSISNTAERYHLALQWEQYAAEEGTGRMQLNEQLRVATRHIDTLDALDANERHLEMSDLRPMVPNEDSGIGRPPGTNAPPYPFSTIAPNASLLLYFEVYHLGFGTDDRTEYTVEYDVHRRVERGRLARLFRGDDEQRTTTSATYEGGRRVTQEEILIDLNDWEDSDRAGEILVTIRVTDETTGQQAERAISFDVVPES